MVARARCDRVADLRRRDGRRLDAQVAEQGDGHAGADRVDRALAAHVPRGVVAAVDVEQPHDRHDASALNFRTVVEIWKAPMFLTPLRLMKCGHPEAGEDEEDRPQLLVARVDKDLDIGDPRDPLPQACGVPAPRRASEGEGTDGREGQRDDRDRPQGLASVVGRLKIRRRRWCRGRAPASPDARRRSRRRRFSTRGPGFSSSSSSFEL